MIDISKLAESDKGRAVTYTAGHGDKEFGVISSWNDRFVFVRYHHLIDPGRLWRWLGLNPYYALELGAKATVPADLEFCP